MSKLDDMIKQLCPDGVEFVKLDDCLSYEQPTEYIVKCKDYIEKGLPVLTAGQTFILGYTDETEGIFSASKENPVIIFDDFTTSFHWVDFDFKIKSSAMKMLRPKTTVNISFRFVYYAMKCIKYQTLEHSRQWISKYSQIEIPLPPLEIQNEIVRILDKFTELEAELEAELDCRKRQYEFYRDRLLSFDKLSPTEKNNVVWMKLSEVAFYAKNRISSKALAPNSYIGVENLLKDKIGRMDKTNTPVGMVIEYLPNDILIGNIRPYLRKLWKANCKGGTNGDVLCIRLKSEKTSTISYDYLYHVLASETFFNYAIKYSKGAKMPRGDKKMIMEFEIPIPPLSEQNRIVAILDRFEALTTSLQNGLPAEIAARRQQYEYYRDKLLDFKRKTA